MGPENSGRPTDDRAGRLADSPDRRVSQPQQSAILLVDDDPRVRNLATRLLEHDGHLVLAAADGQEGLEIPRQYTGSIALVITGVRMPRLNGTDLCAQLFEERPGIKVIFLVSAELNAVFTPRANLPVLTKPINALTLRARVSEILGAQVSPQLDKPLSDPRHEFETGQDRTSQ